MLSHVARFSNRVPTIEKAHYRSDSGLSLFLLVPER